MWLLGPHEYTSERRFDRFCLFCRVHSCVQQTDKHTQKPRNVDDNRRHLMLRIQGGPKKWGHKLMAIILSNLNRFKKRFTLRFLGKFSVNWLIQIPPHIAYVVTLPCETLMLAINNKLQGSVAIYLRRGGKKVAHTRLPSAGFRSWSRFLAVSLQVTWVTNTAVGCHYFPPGLQLPPQPVREPGSALEEPYAR